MKVYIVELESVETRYTPSVETTFVPGGGGGGGGGQMELMLD